MEHDALFALKPAKLKAAGLVNGAFSTTGVPPQEFVIVKVPVVGALVKVTEPLLMSYCWVALLQVVGVNAMPEMEQVTEQGGGAL